MSLHPRLIFQVPAKYARCWHLKSQLRSKTKDETYGNQNITLVLEKAAQICGPEAASFSALHADGLPTQALKAPQHPGSHPVQGLYAHSIARRSEHVLSADRPRPEEERKALVDTHSSL